MNSRKNTQGPKKTQPEEFDLVILGGGTGSTIAAWTFAGQGQRVAVIERKYIGGSCPNIACLPSKNIIHSAKVASYLRRSEEFGIPNRDFAVDMRAVRERKRRMVSSWNDAYLDNYKKSRRGIHPRLRAASSARKPSRPHFLTAQRVNSEGTT